MVQGLFGWLLHSCLLCPILLLHALYPTPWLCVWPAGAGHWPGWGPVLRWGGEPGVCGTPVSDEPPGEGFCIPGQLQHREVEGASKALLLPITRLTSQELGCPWSGWVRGTVPPTTPLRFPASAGVHSVPTGPDACSCCCPLQPLLCPQCPWCPHSPRCPLQPSVSPQPLVSPAAPGVPAASGVPCSPRCPCSTLWFRLAAGSHVLRCSLTRKTRQSPHTSHVPSDQ